MTLYEYLITTHEYVISVDSEYRFTDGNPPSVVCFVYQDIKTGEVWNCTKPEDILDLPFPHDHAVFIVFNAVAEASCWLAWNIPLPVKVIDLWVEFKNLTQDGIKREKGYYSLLNCCHRLGVEQQYIISEEQKEHFRDLIIHQTEYSDRDMQQILDYCKSDVVVTGKLLRPVLDHMELRLSKAAHETRLLQIMFRGIVKTREAQVIHAGICCDNEKLNRFNKYWPEAKENFIADQDKDLDCFEDGVFKQDKLIKLIHKNNLEKRWPKTPKGNYKADEKTLKRFEDNPAIDKLRLLIKLNGSGKMLGYCVGDDGRSRTPLNWFGTVTGRTAASSSKYPFGPSKWVRELLKPADGYTYAYIDYKQQEMYIQAYLSSDQNMIAAIQSGDIYMYTAILAGAAPTGATKDTHPKERQLYKVGVLANSYGMGRDSLAQQLNVSITSAKSIQAGIKRAYPKFFQWQEDLKSRMVKQKRLQTKYGWTRHLPSGDVNFRSVGNWPIQATGAEMTRLAMVMLLDAGFEVHATIHDAVLVMIPNKNIGPGIKQAQEILMEAAEMVIGKEIPTDVDLFESNWKQERNKDKTGDGDLFDSIFIEIDKAATNGN